MGRRANEFEPAPRAAGARRWSAVAALGVSLLLLPALPARLSPAGVAAAAAATAQTGGHVLFGDVDMDESKAGGSLVPLSFAVILYAASGGVIDRQTVPNNGRYRFMNVPDGHYDVAVEVENREVGRVRVLVFSRSRTDFRQDIHLEWRPDHAGAASPRPATISAADFYKRRAAQQSLFRKAQEATDRKKYDEAVSLLKQLLAADPKDFQAWTELGTVHLMRDAPGEAEEAYRRAITERPAFALALLNLGRLLLSQKKYESAIGPLAKAVEAQPTSAQANHLLGEAYLQVKKGSKAVGYLNEALRLDPVGKAEVHLRLAALYNAARLKGLAAEEYRRFLSKRPGHPDRRKFQRYIEENGKQ